MKETIAYLNSLLQDGDTLVIGLSGGPDSMCLLNLINQLDKKNRIICAHINHNIRKESIQEEQFVTDYCTKNKLIIETICFQKKSTNLDYTEQELREKRYQYFDHIIQKYNAKYLFTAHHGDDLIETILMRITRGSNLKGYSGISIETKKTNYSIIRPLLFVTKNDIEIYNKTNNIPYVIDQSNYSEEYTRNRYRKNILPFLKKENKNVHLKYLKFSRELQTYYQFVNNIIEQEFSKRYKNNTLNIKRFDTLDKIIRNKIIEKVLNKQYVDNVFLVNDRHIELIYAIVKSEKPNIEISLPDNLKIIKAYDKIKFTREQNKINEYKKKITKSTPLPNSHIIQIITETEETNNNFIRLNSSEIKMPLYVRNRKNGDKMIIKNMKNFKKIKDIFIDSKMTKEERVNQPIVVDANDTVLWLPGLKKSKFDKAKNDKYDIILWYN